MVALRSPNSSTLPTNDGRMLIPAVALNDHATLLRSCPLPTTVPIAKAIQLIKAGSSAWIDQTFRQLHNFSWQQGDGAFSVSVSQLPETIHSIQNQVEDHRTRTFPQEDLAFLKQHEHSTRCRLLMPGLSFDDKYLWD